MSGLYEISTLEQLQAMNSHLNDRCVLMNDIDASATAKWNLSGSIYQGFLPVGDSTTPFTGSFIGNGYAISNLHINRDIGSLGFFGRIEQLDTLITNGAFTGSATGWTLGTGWAYNSNNVIKNADGTGTLSQTSAGMIRPLVVNEVYILKFKFSSFTAGSVDVTIAGETIGTYTANGTYTVEFTASTQDDLVFSPSNDARLIVDDVILQRKQIFEDAVVRDIDFTQRGNPSFNGVLAGFSGVFVGIAGARIKINGIRVTGKMAFLAHGASFAGGFAGENVYCDFDACSADIAMTLPRTVGAAGGFTGGELSSSSSTYTNCESAGSITQISASNNHPGYIGGFVGRYGTCDQCRSFVSIIAQFAAAATTQISNFGGFAGANVTASLCYSTGNIIVIGNVPVVIGGFAAQGHSESKCFSTSSITCQTANGSVGIISRIGGFVGVGAGSNCYAQGDVCKSGITGNYLDVGGFAGFLSGGTNCYSTGFVGGANSVSGGFCGSRSGTQTSCRYDKETSGKASGVKTGQTSTGITGHTTVEMKIQATFTNWDFDTVWEIRTFERGAIGASNLTAWLSRVGDYDRFEAGVKDNDSFELVIPTANDIRWLGALESLLLGTAGDEWMISSNKLETSLAPTNFKVRQQSEYGSSRIQPIKINSSLMFIDFVARKIREMTQTEEGKYESPDLTALAEHITLHGIISVARQKNPDSIVWCTLGDGSLISMTYEREQDVVAWSKHPIGGNGFCQSVAVLPGATEDIVYLSVKRTINGAEKVYLEKMAPRVFEKIEDAVFLDSSITVENTTPFNEITGLEHLEGEKVSVLASGVMLTEGDPPVETELGDGVVYTGLTVDSGAITLPTGITATKATVGLPFTAKLRPMRIVIGDSMGSEVRVSELVISVQNTGSLKYGLNPDNLIDVDLNDIRWRDKNDSTIDGLFSGEVVVSCPGGFDSLVPIYIVTDSPLPLTIRCIIPRLERTGR